MRMNGRLNKVAMTAKIMRMKTGLYDKSWYPEWDDRQRGAAKTTGRGPVVLGALFLV